MPSYADARVRQVNERPIAESGQYVLYWMQAYRRLDHNHALDHAIKWASHLKKPLVVYDGLKLSYPWASARFHSFILQGMIENRQRARDMDVNYWPFVETPENPGKGILRRVAGNACLVVTDDFPAFIHPGQTAALAGRCPVKVCAVDGNSVVPLSLLGAPVSAAAHIRPRIHRAFSQAWIHRAKSSPKLPKCATKRLEPPFAIWNSDSVEKFVERLPIDQTVRPLVHVIGGPSAARKLLRQFIQHRLAGYATERSRPVPPSDGHASELSGHIHFGHISIEEIIEATLGDWDVNDFDLANVGKREGFFHADPDVNAFLDEAITWRDVGFHWHYHRNTDAKSLDTALPAWAIATLNKHRSDPREASYTLHEFESAATHDTLWNAAQSELVATGRIQNYLRMLWGKKVIEWSESPEQAYAMLEHLNNKYAIDGRDPNSYTGILWCFGLFDRPWAPERKVLGVIRYMSSANTAKKFRLSAYLEYVAQLNGRRAGETLFDDL